MASFVLSFFPQDVLDEIWDLIESVSEGFLTYSFIYICVNMQQKKKENKQTNKEYFSKATRINHIDKPQ